MFMNNLADFAVLCVDDEVEIINALKSCLRREPYTKMFAESGEQALTLLHESQNNARIIVIVTDIQMPGMNGTELINRVKTSFPDTICMLVSGANNINEFIKDGDTAHIYNTITKPIDIPLFKKTINDAIDYYRNTAIPRYRS